MTKQQNNPAGKKRNDHQRHHQITSYVQCSNMNSSFSWHGVYADTQEVTLCKRVGRPSLFDGTSLFDARNQFDLVRNRGMPCTSCNPKLTHTHFGFRRRPRGFFSLGGNFAPGAGRMPQLSSFSCDLFPSLRPRHGCAKWCSLILLAQELHVLQ